MATAVLMPKAGITVESCIIGKWEKKVGDKVSLGDILFTYETDKASFECESTAEGELLEIFYQDGDEVPCLVNVCAVGEKGEDCSALRPEGSAPAAAPEAAPAAAEAPAAAPAAVEAPAEVREGAPVSPRARKLAETAGVDASLAAGTGPNGRIIEKDVRKLMAEGAPNKEAAAPAAAAETAVAAEPAAAAVDYTDSKLPGIRKVIASSMMNSLHGSAQLTHHFSFDATAIKSYRAMMKAAGGDYAGVTLGDMVLYAVSRTLLNHPDMNAHMLDEKTIRRFNAVHLAVAVDTPRGLLVPVIRNADTKSLLQISKELKELAAQAISGAINPDKLSGGTFTVSNLGSFGVEQFTPIINAPQTGILGVCTMTDRPRKGKDGNIELYSAMGLSITYDHRAVNGAPASRFMQELCRNLEQFTTILAN
ncbi:MAG: 2-oxo acid dehydrogenase subunit E2 [Clostridia bacterium]|nr:2-oxo acid dehydrogenase subunit E2 [Clostridia bacterium]